MKFLVWGVQWQRAMVRRRRLTLHVLVATALIVPVVTGALAPSRAAAVSVMLFALFSMLGAALPLLEDGVSGLASRVMRGGIAPWSFLLQRAAVGTVLDVLKLTPGLLVLAWALGASMSEVLLMYAALIGTAWVAGLLGILVGATSRTSGEVIVVSSTVAVLLFHMSGVFRAPIADSFAATLEAASPFRALHEVILSTVTGGTIAGGAAVAVWGLALPILVALLAGRLGSAVDGSGARRPVGA